MMHFASRAISRLLKGRTLTATLTDDILDRALFNGLPAQIWKKEGEKRCLVRSNATHGADSAGIYYKRAVYIDSQLETFLSFLEETVLSHFHVGTH